MYINAERLIETFEGYRDEWIQLLVKNPKDSGAAMHIVNINSKLELLENYRDFTKPEYQE